jgi:rhomboid protease GluP
MRPDHSPFEPSQQASPFNALPPVVVVLALAMLAVEIVLALADAGMIGGPAGIGWRQQAFADYSLWKPVMMPAFEAGVYPANVLMRFVTYPFLHGGFAEMLFPVVILLAVGKFVGEAYSAAALFITWVSAAIGAGLVFLLVQPGNSMVPLAGGMPAGYGLIGALTFLLWQQARWLGETPVKAFRLIGLLTGFQLLILLVFGGSWTHAVAELAAFAIGFGLGFVLAPGRWQMLLAKMRGR